MENKTRVLQMRHLWPPNAPIRPHNGNRPSFTHTCKHS